MDGAATDEPPVGVERLALAAEVVMGDEDGEAGFNIGDDHAYEDRLVVGSGNAEIMGLLLEDGPTADRVAVPMGVT